MTTEDAVQSSRESVRIWNEILVPKFIRWRHIVVAGLAHHGAQIFPKLAVTEGARVVDIGCGFGDTAIELARMVGPTGSVVGLDCCKAFLEYGRQEAKAAGVANLEFVEADVENHLFRPEFDFCFSRFGTMFFEDPVAAFRNIRGGLKPNGTMTMMVWRSLDENPWIGVSKRVILEFLPPPPNARSDGPGPFSMADPDIVSNQLLSAGYSDVEFERIEAPVLIGRTVEEAVEFQLELGPAAEVYREAGELAKEKHNEIVAALKRELMAYQTPKGVLIPSSSWKVSARNPGPGRE